MRLITVAIHTYEHAQALKALLEREGITTVLQNVNLETPTVSSGVRVRIHEHDLPLALRIIENTEIFCSAHSEIQEDSHSIIVPVDFSNYSLNATIVAFQQAHYHGASIKLLHAYIDPYVAGNMQLSDSLTYELADSDARRQIEQNAIEQMAKFSDKLKEMIKYGELPPVKFSTKVVEGVPEDAIIEYAKINPPYLVIMGTRGAAVKRSQMIGSVTAEVLDKCQFSVLAIPEPVKCTVDTKIENIIFFSNLEQQDLLAMDTMARIFDRSTATVTVVHLPQRRRPFERSNRDSIDNIVAYCNAQFPEFKFIASPIKPEDLTADLSSIVGGKSVDLLVLPYKKKNAIARFFNPGVAHKILTETDIPMFVIPV